MIVVFIILFFITLALFNTWKEEVPSREIDSLLMGISISSFILSILALFDEGKLDWGWLNSFMKWPKKIRILVPFIIGLIVAIPFYFFYTEYLEDFGGPISNSTALIAFSLVITNYLGETQKKQRRKSIRKQVL